MSKRLLAVFLILPFLVSCAKESGGASETLVINSVTATDGVKSVVSGSTFASDKEAAISVTLTDEDGFSPYDGKETGYNNIAYIKPAKSNVWNTGRKALLTKSKGKIFAYYPYDPTVADITKIPIVSSIDGDDYMVATPKTGVCDSYYAVSLEMKHIMARITLNISKDASYEGLGKLSQITLESDGITQSGTMNAKDGSLWWESSSDVIFPELKTTLSSKVTVQECLVIPTGYSAAKQNLTVRCVVDGQEYNTAFLGENGIVISAGTHSTINLTLSKI